MFTFKMAADNLGQGDRNPVTEADDDVIPLGPEQPNISIVHVPSAVRGAEANVPPENNLLGFNRNAVVTASSASRPPGMYSRWSERRPNQIKVYEDFLDQVHWAWAEKDTRYSSYVSPNNTEIMGRGRRESFAIAGLFYDRRGKRTMCFRCGIIIKNWRSHHDPAVMHAYFSPQCEYLELYFGQSFVQTVTTLSQTVNVHVLTETDVLQHMRASGIQLDRRNEDKLTQAAISTVQDIGIPVAQIYQAVATLRNQRLPVSALNIFQHISSARPIHHMVPRAFNIFSGIKETNLPVHSTESHLDQQMSQLQQRRDQWTCIVCLYRAIEILIIPCGHIVLCIECCFLLKVCPHCLESIGGLKRMYIS
uniref:RING-type domain-containing protein n=2 Tax=Arion vulgaris TaxID=1028688 RepID=A0A0B6YSX8_9EUPU